MFRRVSKDNIFLDQQASNRTSALQLDVSDYRHCILQVVTTGSFVGTIFVVGAIGSTKPSFTWSGIDFDTNTEHWDYIEAINLRDGTPIDGNTGIELSTSVDTVRLYEVNINALDWLGIIVTAIQAGAVSVRATVATNA